jgi:uncharacterized protein (TIGR03435 family)
MKLGFLVALFIAVLAADRPLGAQADDSKITFEVASVKPAGPFVPGAPLGIHGGPGTDDPGRITATRATLSDLLMEAYDVWTDQISGPAWLSDSRTYVYAINATMAPGTTKDQFRLMLRNLLAERFHVRLHHDAQTRPGYELVVANGGPKLKEWKPVTDAAPGKPGVDGNGFLRLPPSAGPGMAVRIPRSGGTAPIRMTFRESMAGFCRGLGFNINRSNGAPAGSPQPRVVDRTGLTGIYDFTLEFAGTMPLPPGTTAPAPPADDAGMPAASDPGEGLPNIFTAVEKQLGLKLVKVKDVPVDVLNVDNADKVPTEN